MASGYDISASASDATTMGQQGGSFIVTGGGGNSVKWVLLALVGLGALALVLVFTRK